MALDVPQLDSFDSLAHVLFFGRDIFSDFRHTSVFAVKQLLGCFIFKQRRVLACGKVVFSLYDHILRGVKVN